MPEERAFWLADNFDREHGTGGRGRYDAEVLARIDDFADSWGDLRPRTARTVPSRSWPGGPSPCWCES